jgi:hypothetical protein
MKVLPDPYDYVIDMIRDKRNNGSFQLDRLITILNEKFERINIKEKVKKVVKETNVEVEFSFITQDKKFYKPFKGLFYKCGQQGHSGCFCQNSTSNTRLRPNGNVNVGPNTQPIAGGSYQGKNLTTNSRFDSLRNQNTTNNTQTQYVTYSGPPRCFKCGKLGHKAFNCWTNVGRQDTQNTSEKDNHPTDVKEEANKAMMGNLDSDSSDDGMCLMVHIEEVIDQDDSRKDIQEEDKHQEVYQYNHSPVMYLEWLRYLVTNQVYVVHQSNYMLDLNKFMEL